jgi:hypothetical protein
MTSGSDEPHFGEVWMWSNMGPFMVIAMEDSPPGRTSTRDVVVANVSGIGTYATATLHWDGEYRKDWHHIDKGELV